MLQPTSVSPHIVNIEVDEIMTSIFDDCDWADDHSGPEGDSDI